MSKTPSQISSDIRATLATTLPGLSCAVGTPERKIIDAVATAISPGYMGNYLNGSLFDIDSMTGLQLEQMVGIFGFGRLQGTPAVGTAQVSLAVESTSNTTFSAGTQFTTKPGLAGISTTLTFTSTSSVVLPAGNTVISIPVKCTTVGSQGNIPPDSLTYTGSMTGGSTCTNLTAMTGGTDTETDQQLRQRFKDTLLRNIAGTSDFYIALCQQNSNVARVAVYGPVALYSTQITPPAAAGDSVVINTRATPSGTSDIKYVWNGMSSAYYNLGQETGEVFYSDISDYTFTGGDNATFTTVSQGELDPSVSGQTVPPVIGIDFQYVSMSSRNDPPNGITNKVDLFVDGINPTSIIEVTTVGSSANTLTNGPTDVLFNGNFLRTSTGTVPSVGNTFTRIGSVPVVTPASTITIDGITYSEGSDYFWLMPNVRTTSPNSITTLAGSRLEISGIEWVQVSNDSSATPPAAGAGFSLTYTYNNIPEVLDSLISTQRQICTDVLVHQGNYVYLRPTFNIAYQSGYAISTVNAAITASLQAYFSGLGFGTAIFFSALTMMVQQTLGVASVSLPQIECYADGAGKVLLGTLTTDFNLSDNQIGAFLGATYITVADIANIG